MSNLHFIKALSFWILSHIMSTIVESKQWLWQPGLFTQAYNSMVWFIWCKPYPSVEEWHGCHSKKYTVFIIPWMPLSSSNNLSLCFFTNYDVTDNKFCLIRVCGGLAYLSINIIAFSSIYCSSLHWIISLSSCSFSFNGAY